MNWTAEQSETVKTLWLAGVSSSEIAEQMKCTRNSIIGRVHRMGLVRPEKPDRITAVKKRTVADNNPLGIKARHHAFVRPAELPKPDKTLAQIKAEPNPPEFLSIPFMDLQDHHCRYPRGENPILFCGQPKVVGSYCAGCASRCFAAPQERKQRPWVDRRAA